MTTVHSKVAAPGKLLGAEDAAAVVAGACPEGDYRGKRVLLIIPDLTRTAPIGMMFRLLHSQLGGVTAALGRERPSTAPHVSELYLDALSPLEVARPAPSHARGDATPYLPARGRGRRGENDGAAARPAPHPAARSGTRRASPW